MSNTIEKTALLVMDVQDGILARLENPQEFIEKTKTAVDAAHKNNIPVIFVIVGFRPGFPEISARNKAFSERKASGTTSMINPKPSIEPTDKDVVVTKRRISAFSGSDLQVVLSGLNIEHLILTGVATSGVVLSTTREAADKDYRITILSDLCNDADPEVHRVLLEKILPRQAEVITSEKWISQLS